MRKVKAVGPVTDTCSFLFAGTCKDRVMMVVVCRHMSYLLRGTSGLRMIWEAIPGKEGGRGGPT